MKRQWDKQSQRWQEKKLFNQPLIQTFIKNKEGDMLWNKIRREGKKVFHLMDS